MSDRSPVTVTIYGWPAALLKRESRSQLHTREVYEVWTFDLAPLADASGFGGNPEWVKLGEVLTEIGAPDLDWPTFEAYEGLDLPEGFRSGEYGTLSFTDPEAGGGSYTIREESDLAETLRALGLAYEIAGDGYYSEWEGDFTCWRPGWPEPVSGIAFQGEPRLDGASFWSTFAEAKASLEAEGEPVTMTKARSKAIALMADYFAAPSEVARWRPWQGSKLAAGRCR